MFDQDVELSFRMRRSAYVVDPLLALGSPYGAQLTSRLSAFADVWATRTFWQVIDASDYYRSDPLALWPSALRERLPDSVTDDFRRALALWQEVRQRTDLSHCRLHWVSDNVNESSFPDGTAPDLFERYEALHQGLTARCDPNDEATESAWFFGAIDSLSLAAALGQARVLTLAPDVPGACLSLACERVGLDVRSPPPSEARLTLLERRRAHDLLVTAGCVPLFWGGLRVAVVHPLLCGELTLRAEARESELSECLVLEEDFPEFDDAVRPPSALDPWKAARAFWHCL